jgi:hypothetical protein
MGVDSPLPLYPQQAIVPSVLTAQVWYIPPLSVWGTSQVSSVAAFAAGACGAESTSVLKTTSPVSIRANRISLDPLSYLRSSLKLSPLCCNAQSHVHTTWLNHPGNLTLIIALILTKYNTCPAGCLSQDWLVTFDLFIRHNTPLYVVRGSTDPRPGYHQTAGHPGPILVTAHGSGSHFHAAYALFGGIVRPRHIWLPIKNPKTNPIFCQTNNH